MYGGMCSGEYTISMLEFIQFMKNNKIEYQYFFRFNESLIQRARNFLAHCFLQSDATHLLFIDADIKFNAQEVWKMLEQDKDIICGIYPSKGINWHQVGIAARSNISDQNLKYSAASWVVNLVDFTEETKIEMDKPFEIYNGGTGMMAIKRNVFEKLKNKTLHYLMNENDIFSNQFKNQKIGNYFHVEIDEKTGVLLSEDYYFCTTWRRAGGKIYAAPWVNLSHIGTYTFEGRPK